MGTFSTEVAKKTAVVALKSNQTDELKERTCFGPPSLLCGQSCLLGIEACAAVTRARHQREAGLFVPLQGAGQ